MDSKLKKSTAFHPQIDGQTEVVNRTVVQLLRGYCSKHLKIWDEQLQYIQHAYNHAVHSSTNRSPFETCFGYLPKTPMDFSFGKYAVDGHHDANKVLRVHLENPSSAAGSSRIVGEEPGKVQSQA